jgi:hypothetical protein
MTALPGVARSPGVSPRLEPRFAQCLRPRVVIVAEALGKSPACGSLRGSSGAGFPSRRLYSQSLLARQIALLQALLLLQLTLLYLQQPLLRLLRPLALRLFRLQPLHALLQTIDALLALHALARKDLALPLLHGLLPLDLLLLSSFYPLVPQPVGAQG